MKNTKSITNLVFEAAVARLWLPEAISLAKDLASTDSHDWWKSLRTTLHKEFSNA